MYAKVVASLLNVAGKVAQALVIEDGASAGRVYVGGAEEADRFELRKIDGVVEESLVFGIDGVPTEGGDGGVDG